MLQHRADRLHGTVILATPISWQVVGFMLFAMLVGFVVFLLSASYARVEAVSGSIALDSGVATMLVPKGGVVSAVLVAQGQEVRAGQRLVDVRLEQDLMAGSTGPARMRRAIEAQDRHLAEQSALLAQAAVAEQKRLRTQIAGARVELAEIGAQIDDQRLLVRTAAQQLANARVVAQSGYMSRRDLDAVEATLISRRQQLAQLSQTMAAKNGEINAATMQIDQSAASMKAQVATSESARGSLGQQLAQVDQEIGYALTAPVDGIVTALTARVGQTAMAGDPMLILVPRHSHVVVELQVPTSSAGFISVGQEVRLAIDAFPYQTFGTVPATITSVSAATSTKQSSNGPIPFYLVNARLSKPWIKAFGRRQMLVPGMALTGRIVTERRSLIRWLFEPLFAVADR